MWAESKHLFPGALNKLQDGWHSIRLSLGSDATYVKYETFGPRRGSKRSFALLLQARRAPWCQNAAVSGSLEVLSCRLAFLGRRGPSCNPAGGGLSQQWKIYKAELAQHKQRWNHRADWLILVSRI